MAKQIASARLVEAVRALGFDPNYVHSLELKINNNVGPPMLVVHLFIDADRAADLLAAVDRDEVIVVEHSIVDGDRLRPASD
jgi:hypothetical protein